MRILTLAAMLYAGSLANVANAQAMQLPENLPGVWTTQADKSTYRFEVWEYYDDSTFRGMGGKVKESDTVFKEKLWLQLRQGRLYYMANAEGQNGNRYITFPCIETRGSYVFSNPQHDFPKNIVYHFVNPTEMYVEINADMNGEALTNSWTFSKETTTNLPMQR